MEKDIQKIDTNDYNIQEEKIEREEAILRGKRIERIRVNELKMNKAELGRLIRSSRTIFNFS